MNSRAVCALIASAAFSLVSCDHHPTIDSAAIGRIELFQPKGRPNGLVFLLSDMRGWSSDLTALAKHLREHGLIVAGVDSRKLVDKLAAGDEQCLSLVDAFEAASQQIQRDARLDVYFLPVLAGVGEGATLALAGLWQAGPETIAGAVTVDFGTELATPRPLCATPPARLASARRGFDYSPPQRLFGWWQAAWTGEISNGTRAFAASLGVIPATVQPGLSPPRQLARLFDWSNEERARDTADALKLGDLAVVELPGRPGSDTAAIILSGDGGWRDLDRTLGEILATSGVHVIGIDCLRYYWNRKPPETTAADLERLIVELSARTGIRKIALIGFSFGADVLPFIYTRLSPEVRDRVVLLSLLAPGRDAHFEIQVAGWLGVDASKDATPIAPELAKIDSSLVQCVYGEEEAAQTVCRDAAPQSGEVIGIPGGHHFDEDYQALAQRILRRLNMGIRPA